MSRRPTYVALFRFLYLAVKLLAEERSPPSVWGDLAGSLATASNCSQVWRGSKGGPKLLRMKTQCWKRAASLPFCREATPLLSRSAKVCNAE